MTIKSVFEKLKRQVFKSKNFIYFSIFNIGGQVIAMCTPFLLAKIFTPEIFGSYSLARMIVFFFTSMLLASFQTPFIVNGSQELEKTGKFNKSFTIQLVLTGISVLLFSLLLFVFQNPLVSFAKIDKTQLFYLFFAYLGLAGKSILTNIFLVRNQKIFSAVIEFLFNLVNGLVLLITFFIFEYQNFNIVFLSYFIGFIFCLGVFISKSKRNDFLPFEWDQKIFIEIFNFTKWQILGLTAVYLVNWGDNFVLRYFVSMEKIGVYNLAYQIFKGVITVLFILNTYFTPFVVRNIKNKDKMKKYLYKTRFYIMAIIFAGIIFLDILGPLFIDIFYSESYLEAKKVLIILSFALLTHGYLIFYLPIFNTLSKYKFIQLSNVFQIILNILFNVILIRYFGIAGVALGTLISYIIKSIIFEIYFRKKIKKDILG